jgi:MFS family permease
MSLILVLVAVGGGMVGAAIGATPAFVFTGITGLIGWAIVLAGGSDAFLNNVAFGGFFGPHVAFAGGVAAAAFAANKRKKLGSGTDLNTALYEFNDPSILLIGGLFGGLGYCINYLYATVLHIPNDTVAFTVATSGLIARFVFGSSGLIGKFTPSKPDEKREFFPDGTSLATSLIFAAGIAFTASYVADITQTGIVFTISAASLMFAQMGFNIPATHHITAVAGVAVLTTGSIYYGLLFGVISALIFEIVARTFNSHVDSHIDPPAVAIAICTFIVMGFMG